MDMKRRIKLKKKNNKIHKYFSYIVFIILLVIIVTSFFLSFVNKRVSPILLDFAEIKIKKLATLVINRAISKQIASGIELDKLIITTKNNAGEIQSIDFDPIIVNRVLNQATNVVQINLKALEEGNIHMIELPDDDFIGYDKEKLKRGIVYEIPLGAVTKNSLLSNIGPKIPVRFSMVSGVNGNIKTRIKSYGINNAMIEIFIRIEISEKVILPLTSKKVTVSNDVPVAIKIIQGKIPEYYLSGFNQSTPIYSLPIESK
jgi:sporulation protein YunB